MKEIRHISFVVEGEIITKARPRTRIVKKGDKAYAQTYTTSETTIYENLVKLCYRQATDYYYGDDPLSVTIVAHFKRPEALARFKGNYPSCLKHKDLDNIAKTILDALNKVAYDDDKQVWELNCSKLYDEREYVEVFICNHGVSLGEAKEKLEIDKIEKRVDELSNKEKLTKSEKDTLEKLRKKIVDYYWVGESNVK